MTATYQFLDPGRCSSVGGRSPPPTLGRQVDLVSFSDDRRKFLVRVDSPTDGPAYAYVDLDTKTGRWLADEFVDLKPDDISPVRSIAFKAKDGLPLTGYLTLPRGKEAKNLPLVVFPHGGPAARDEPGFDWWAQAMASRGYAVLQVNYRGSEGFGWSFLSAGFGQWGRKMQTDLSDGVRYLASQGTVDPKRVCIVGASYGGYAALAGAALDPGVYRCAAAVAGIADLAKFVGWAKSDAGGGEGVGVQRYWLRYMGPPATLAEISPAEQVAKVTIPVLLVHGKDDTVVPYAQPDDGGRSGRGGQTGGTRHDEVGGSLALTRRDAPADADRRRRLFGEEQPAAVRRWRRRPSEKHPAGRRQARGERRTPLSRRPCSNTQTATARAARSCAPPC